MVRRLGLQIKSTMRYHGWLKRAKMNKTDHRGLCGNENSHTLLVEVKSGMAALANSVTVP